MIGNTDANGIVDEGLFEGVITLNDQRVVFHPKL
jgi:hypothetical protein